MNIDNKLEERIEEKIEENNFLFFLRRFLLNLKDHNVTAIASQLSYYLLISLFPFTIFLLNILSFTPLASQEVISNLVRFLPRDIQEIIMALVSETVTSSSETLLSFSVITGLWAASKGAMAFIKVMNQAYEAQETRSYISTRFISILITLGLILAFLIVLLTLVFGEVIGVKLFSRLGFAEDFIYFWAYFRKILPLVAMIVIFALLYKYAPATHNRRAIKLKETLAGAVFASLGWVITSIIFSYYVNNLGNFAKTYGSLAGIVVLLLWLFLSSNIIIIGGEINAILEYMRSLGRFEKN